MAGAGRLLVIGASGILAPLVANQTAAGRAVIAVRRSADVASRAWPGRPLTADTTTAAGAAAVTAHGPYEQAVIYGPAVVATTLRQLLAAVTGRAVLVVTSSVADPRTGHEPGQVADVTRPRPGDAVLALGWLTDPPRWHSAAQVSRAAEEVLRVGDDAVLGSLRPWDGRPR